jgi:hypothetical protein
MLTTLDVMQQRKKAVEATLLAARHRYEVRVWDESSQKLLAHPAVPEIEWNGGDLYVDGHPILEPKVDGNVVSWLQISTDHFCAGTLQFTEDRLAFIGSLSIGRDETSAEIHSVAGAVPPSVYRTKVAAQGYDGDKPGPVTGWSNALTLTLGYELSEDDHMPVLIVKVNGVDCMAEGSAAVSLEDGHLKVTLLSNDDVPDYAEIYPEWPGEAVFTFSWDADSFSGWLRKYDAAQKDRLTAKRFQWLGELSEQPALLRTAPRRLAKESVTLRAAEPLTLAELKSLHPENLDAILNDHLLENMKYAMDDNLRVTFFGQTKPDLPEGRRKLVEQDKEFYRDKFAVSYLAWGLNQSDGAVKPSNPLNDKEKKRLKYFLHHGLAKSEAYNRQSNGMFRSAYLVAAPRLRAYAADNGEEWAKKLFNHLMRPQNLVEVIAAVKADGGKTEIPQRYCNLLWALAPEKDYPVKYYNQVLSGVLGWPIEEIEFTEETKDHIVKWAKDWIQRFVEQNFEKPDVETQGALARWKLAKDLKEVMDKTANAEQLAKAMAQAMIAANPGKNLWERTIRAEAWLVEKYPAFGKVLGRAVRVGAWCYGMYTVAGSYMRWEDLDEKQRISLVTETVALARNLIMQIPGIVSEVADILAWKAARQAVRVAPEAGVAGVLEGAAAGREPWIQRAARNMDGFVRDAKAANNSFGRFFRIVGKIVQIAGVLISAVYTAISVWNFIDQVNAGAPTLDLAFNGIVMAASLVETCALLLSLFLTSSLLTIIGGVAALIGLVFALVQMFRTRDTPPNPIDEFMDGKGRGLIGSLEDPPADWKEPGQQLLLAAAAVA